MGQTCSEKQLALCRNWFGPLQLICVGMARLLLRMIKGFFRVFFLFSSTRQHTRINADFIIAEQLPAMVINADLLVLSSLWRRLPLQTLQITVIHHGAALHRRQSWINSLKLHKHTNTLHGVVLQLVADNYHGASCGDWQARIGGNISKEGFIQE